MKNWRSGRSSRPGSQMRMSGGTLTRSGRGGAAFFLTERTGTWWRSPIPSLPATLPAYLNTLLSQVKVVFGPWDVFRSVYTGSSPSVSFSSSPAPSTSFYSSPEAHGPNPPSTPSSSTQAPSPWTPKDPSHPLDPGQALRGQAGGGDQTHRVWWWWTVSGSVQIRSQAVQ